MRFTPAERRQNLRDKRRKLGLCKECGGSKNKNFTRCMSCRLSHSAYMRQRRKDAKSPRKSKAK